MSAASTRPVPFVVDQLLSRTAGTEKQLLELIKGLTVTPFEPHLAILRATASLSASDWFLCPVDDLKLPRLLAFDAVPRLLELSRLGARVVHTFFNDASIAAPPFCRLGGARVASSRRDILVHEGKPCRSQVRQDLRRPDRRQQHGGPGQRGTSAKDFRWNRMAVVPNGHDLERFDQPASDALRARLSLGPEAVVIGMVANFNAWKRQTDLIAALPWIRAAHPAAHLLLVGRGDELSNLRQQADRIRAGGPAPGRRPSLPAAPWWPDTATSMTRSRTASGTAPRTDRSARC
jgi:glycosyltransferase involved in cell wall biosynthesis